MFEAYPFLNGKYLYYSTYFAISVILAVLGAYLLTQLISCLLSCFHSRQMAKVRPVQNRGRTDTEGGIELSNRSIVSNNSDEDHFTTQQPSDRQGYRPAPVPSPYERFQPIPQPTDCPTSCVGIAASFCSEISFFFGTLVFILIGGFDFYPWPVGMILHFLAYSLRKLANLIYEYRENPINQESPFSVFVTRYIPYFILYAAYSLALSYGLSGMCVANNNNILNGIGQLIHMPHYSITSYLMRYLWLGKQCEGTAPCHVYVTLPERSTTAAFLNVHTAENIDSISVTYYVDGDNSSPHLTGIKPYLYRYGEEDLSIRNIHTVLLHDLKPNTTYLLNISTGVTTIMKYKTPPDSFRLNASKDSNQTLIKMISGGDFGTSTNGSKLFDNLGNVKGIDLMVVGGDIAYDNHCMKCYYVWDALMRRFQEHFDKIGYMYPLILAVGNHDVGLNPESEVVFPISQHKIAYFSWFPQHFDSTGDGIPDVASRRSYFWHRFGDILLFTVDSGMAAPLEGAQFDFLNKVFTDEPKTLKMMNYHYPLYPVCISSTDHRDYLMKYVGSAIDKYNVFLVLEHHSHYVKRTIPIRNDAPAKDPANATVYIGNGAFAVDLVAKCPPNQNPLLAKADLRNHYWTVGFQRGQLNLKAIDTDNITIDEATIPIAA